MSEEAPLSAIDRRVTNLETTLTQSLARIEGLIRQEIQDLKTEQLGDVKRNIDRIERDLKEDLKRIERDLKEEAKRIADDQRRLWEATRALEGRDRERAGATKQMGWFGNIIAIGLGGGIGSLITAWLSAGKPHP